MANGMIIIGLTSLLLTIQILIAKVSNTELEAKLYSSLTFLKLKNKLLILFTGLNLALSIHFGLSVHNTIGLALSQMLFFYLVLMSVVLRD